MDEASTSGSPSEGARMVSLGSHSGSSEFLGRDSRGSGGNRRVRREGVHDAVPCQRRGFRGPRKYRMADSQTQANLGSRVPVSVAVFVG